MRDRLVHGYADIDHARIHDVLRDRLQDLQDYATAIGALARPT